MKGIIGIPHTGDLPIEFVKSLLVLDRPAGTDLYDVPNSTIDKARNLLVSKMLNEGYEWILFIDSDMTFDPDTLTHMLSLNKPVVTAMCFKRVEPYTPCFYSEVNATDTGVTLTPYEIDDIPAEPFQVEACGAACLLIRREVFETLKWPWFFMPPFYGEDIYFCSQLKKAGIPIWVDPAPLIGHLERRPVDIFTHLQYKAMMEGDQ